MSKEQFEIIVTNQVTNQAMLVAILKVLGVGEKEVNKLGNLGKKTADIFFKSLEEMEKKNGK